MNDARTSAEIFDRAASGAGKQRRSLATRKELVTAARKIFARDGFELARLEDIASAAGKTRGAFYAHFRDKEDVFLAIFEEDMLQDTKLIYAPLSAATTCAERVEVLAQHLAAMLKDRRRMLLNLEFKGYAIRHARRKKRLEALVEAISVSCAQVGIDQLIPELWHKDAALKQAQAAQFGALVDGLALNRLFNPGGLSDRQILRSLRIGIEAILTQFQPHASLEAEPAVR